MPPATSRLRSFPPIADGDTRVLILGSLPGAASLTAGRYYAHPQNQFWRLVGAVVERDLVALPYEARLEALARAEIGLWDMVAEASRQGSLDSAIRDARTNDLVDLTRRLPKLAALGFNGKTAATLALRHMPKAATRYATIALPSSSAAYTLAFEAKRDAWLTLRQFL